MGSENVDRLSGLPEEIQSHILSLVPTKFAVQTCVLSKRWRYTWMSITNLDFDDKPPLGFSNLEMFIDRVLEFCKSSQLDSLRLNFERIHVQGSSVSNWIDNAVMLNVRELVINMFFKLPSSVLPSSLFTCTTLTKLEIWLGNEWECPSMVSLPCLRTLDVKVSTFSSAFKLIAGSPILEDLSLQILRDGGEEDYIFDIPTLKRLDLLLFFSFSSHINKLVLRVPKLEHLLYLGELHSLFVMEDVSSLVEASFCFIGKFTASLLVELLKGISGVKLLSLVKGRDTEFQDSSLLKIISASPLQVFPNMERLDLTGIRHFEAILKFLESSPELKEISIGKLKGSRPKLVPACMLTKLTTIKLRNFKWRKSEVPFLKFLLGNAKVLKTMTIRLKKWSMEEEMRLAPQLLKLPRASSCCEIQILK